MKNEARPEFPAQLQLLRSRSPRSTSYEEGRRAYASLRVRSYVEAMQLGKDRRSATRWAARMESCRKLLVAKIEASGGAAAGHA